MESVLKPSLAWGRAIVETLCTSIHSSGKFAAALKTIKNLKGPRSSPPHPRDGASEAPVSLREWCLASYHDAPFIRWCTSSHVQNSSHRPWAFWATIMATFTLPLMRRNFAMFLYIWYVYRLMGGTGACLCTSQSRAQNSRRKSPRSVVQRLGGGGRGCHNFVPVFGGDGTRIAPPGDFLHRPPGEMS